MSDFNLYIVTTGSLADGAPFGVFRSVEEATAALRIVYPEFESWVEGTVHTAHLASATVIDGDKFRRFVLLPTQVGKWVIL